MKLVLAFTVSVPVSWKPSPVQLVYLQITGCAFIKRLFGRTAARPFFLNVFLFYSAFNWDLILVHMLGVNSWSLGNHSKQSRHFISTSSLRTESSSFAKSVAYKHCPTSRNHPIKTNSFLAQGINIFVSDIHTEGSVLDAPFIQISMKSENPHNLVSL